MSLQNAFIDPYINSRCPPPPLLNVRMRRAADDEHRHVTHPSHVAVELRLKTPPGVFRGPVFYGANGRLLRVQVSCPSYGQMPGGLSTFELKFLVFSRYSTGILSNCYDSI